MSLANWTTRGHVGHILDFALENQTRQFIMSTAPSSLTEPGAANSNIALLMSESSIIITDEYLKSQGLSKNFLQRFWAKVNKTESCWIWNAGCSTGGYGLLKKGSKGTIESHRASWIIHNGPIPKGLCVLHDCPSGDNRLCVNPNHLWIGTKTENNQDRDLKNRQAKGEGNGKSKLTNEKVLEIRRLAQEMSWRKVARKIGVAKTTVQDVLKRRSWKHVL